MEFEHILRNSFSKCPSYFVINSAIAHWSFTVSKDACLEWFTSKICFLRILVFLSPCRFTHNIDNV